MTVNEIKKELDKLGIKYDKNAKKDKLLKLLNEHNHEVNEEKHKKYIVVFPRWRDLEDNDYIYEKGDPYPRDGYTPTQKRISQLTTKNNKIGKVLIKEVE